MIEVSRVCYKVDISKGDSRSAWFVDGAPTKAEKTVSLSPKKSNYGLKQPKISYVEVNF
jgi:hypothetical protein